MENEPKQAAHVRQALAERANAEALGLTDRVTAADKVLDAAGVPAEKRGAEVLQGPPQERHAQPRETAETGEAKRGPGRPRKE